MFSFVNKIPKDRLADVKAVERWLANFPPNDPLALHREVLTELGRLTERDARLTVQRLEAVFHLDTRADDLRKTLTAQYIEHANRSSRIENQLWSSLFDLTQAFLLAYQAFSREIAHRTLSGKWEALLPQLIARQIIHLTLDAKIRLFRCEQWIPAKWAELHGLFMFACSHQLERQSIVLEPDGSTTSIEQEYLCALVLQLVNSGNLTARHLEWIAQQLEEWCSPLRLTLEPMAMSSFYVDLGGREGLKRRGLAPLEGRVLFLDTRPLHASLRQNVLVLEQKINSQPLSERAAMRGDQLNLLTKLATQVDPEFRPVARRGERTSAVGTVDAIVGFAKICGYLRDEEREPASLIDAGKNYSGTMDLALFGRMRNERDRAPDAARQRLAVYATPGGPWDVKDISQTGFRLIAPMSVAAAVTLGTLTAIRAHGEALWMLGIVRRMKRQTTDRAEIGLQVIANALIGVDLYEQRKRNDTEYSVEGESTTINGRMFHGLFLALRKRDSDSAVQSLIVPAQEYQPGRKVKLQTGHSMFPIRFGHLVEQQPDWVWAVVEPLERGASLPAVTGATSPAID
jgi:cyclic-di-GMP-binding protein